MAGDLELGQTVRRIGDGQLGRVAMEGPYRVVVYELMGAEYKSRKLNEWDAVAKPKWPLRPEEKRLIALAADAKLRAVTEHTPDRWWDGPGPVYDSGLIEVIEEYLSR